MLNRRDMIKRGAVGIGAVAVGGPLILMEVGCKSADADFYINLASSTLTQLSPLLPSAAAFIAKGVKVLADIKTDYDKGDFTNAEALLKDLNNIMIQIQTDAGLTNPKAKLIFAIAAVAINTIATLLIGNPVAMATARIALGAQVSVIERLGSAQRTDAIFQSVKF